MDNIEQSQLVTAHKRRITAQLVSIANSRSLSSIVSLDSDGIWSLDSEFKSGRWPYRIGSSKEIPEAVQSLGENMDWRDWVDSEVDV